MCQADYLFDDLMQEIYSELSLSRGDIGVYGDHRFSANIIHIPKDGFLVINDATGSNGHAYQAITYVTEDGLKKIEGISPLLDQFDLRSIEPYSLDGQITSLSKEMPPSLDPSQDKFSKISESVVIRRLEITPESPLITAELVTREVGKSITINAPLSFTMLHKISLGNAKNRADQVDGGLSGDLHEQLTSRIFEPEDLLKLDNELIPQFIRDAAKNAALKIIEQSDSSSPR